MKKLIAIFASTLITYSMLLAPTMAIYNSAYTQNTFIVKSCKTIIPENGPEVYKCLQYGHV